MLLKKALKSKTVYTRTLARRRRLEKNNQEYKMSRGLAIYLIGAGCTTTGVFAENMHNYKLKRHTAFHSDKERYGSGNGVFNRAYSRMDL